MVDKINSNQSYTGLVQKYIGTAYDTVKVCADNIDDIIALGGIDGIEDIVDNINSAEEHALAAAQSASEAAASAAEADSIVSAFNDFYLGVFSLPPIVDNDGAPLIQGALYLDSSVTPMEMLFWSGTEWGISYSSLANVEHSALLELGADDHIQYLTAARHVAIVGNIHKVSLTQLEDVPSSIVGQAGKSVLVKTDETGFEYGVVEQDYLPLSGGTISGDINVSGFSRSSQDPVNGDDLVRLSYFNTHVTTGAYLPLTGGILSGKLIVEDRIEVIRNPGDQYGGFTIYEPPVGTTAPLFKGAFDVDSYTSRLQIHQVGPVNNAVDTVVEIYDGLIHMQSPSKKDVNKPLLPEHLATRGYVDSVAGGGGGGLSLALDGSNAMTGTINAFDRVEITAGDAVSDSGIALYDINNNVKGGFYFDKSANVVGVAQRGGVGPEGPSDTVLQLKDGYITVLNPSNSNSTYLTPTLNEHLATKGYVDSRVDGGTGIPYLPLTGGNLTGELTAKADIVSIYQDANAGGKFVMQDITNTLQGAIFWDGATDQIKITQRNTANTAEETTVTIDAGVIEVSRESGTTHPQTANQLANKGYVDQEVNTVKNGYSPLTGGALTGELRISDEVYLDADPTNPYTGFNINKTASGFKAALYWDRDRNTTCIGQISGDAGGDIDTVLELKDGNASLYSAPAGIITPVAPTLDEHLVTLKYFNDNNAAGDFLPLAGNVTMTGPFNMAAENLSIFAPNAITHPGFRIFDSTGTQSGFKGSFNYSLGSDAIEITQSSVTSGGSAETVARFAGGRVFISSATLPDNIHDLEAFDTALATVKYVKSKVGSDAYLPLSGGGYVTGNIGASGSISAYDYTPFKMYQGELGGLVGQLVTDPAGQYIRLEQKLVNPTGIATILELSDGKATLWSTDNKSNIAVDPNDIIVKQYFAEPGFEVQEKINVTRHDRNRHYGYTITDGISNKAAMYIDYLSGNSTLHITQRGNSAEGSADTELLIANGQLVVGGAGLAAARVLTETDSAMLTAASVNYENRIAILEAKIAVLMGE